MKFLSKLRRSSSKKQPKGAAIIATLFAIGVVLTLGVAFLMLTINESRNTRTEKESVMAKNIAISGIEMVLNLMSCPVSQAVTGGDPVVWQQGTRLRTDPFYVPYEFRAYPRSSGTPLTLRSASVTSPPMPASERLRFYIEPSWGTIGRVGGNNIQGWTYQVYLQPSQRVLNPFYNGEVSLTVRQGVFNLGQPPIFIITSIGRIYRAGNTHPAASRQIEVRLRQKTAVDHLTFCQNNAAADWTGTVVPPPNSVTGNDDGCGIPANYMSNGSMVCDGNSDFASHTAGNLNFFSTTNVNMYGSVSINQGDNVYPSGTTDEERNAMFKGGLTKNQASIGLPGKDDFMSRDTDGNGTVTTTEVGEASRLAQDSSGTNPAGFPYVDAHYRCGDNDGFSTVAGRIGHPAGNPADWPDATAADSIGSVVPADIEFDPTMTTRPDGTVQMQNPKPGIAKFIIEFSQGTDASGNVVGYVTLTKQTAYTGRSVTLLNRVRVDQFKQGMLYIEGGNVEVKNAQLNGGVNGRLTVVAAEHPTREARGFEITTNRGTFTQTSSKDRNRELGLDPRLQVPGKIKLNAGETISGSDSTGYQVRQLYRENWLPESSTTTTDYQRNAHNIYLPYNDTRLPIRTNLQTGRLEDDQSLSNDLRRTYARRSNGGPFKINGRWVWPGESTIRNSVVNDTANRDGVFRDCEREGNITLGGNITYRTENSSLGLVAKNYILINPDLTGTSGSGHRIDIRAVLMSFDHSLQFDDANMSRKHNLPRNRTLGELINNGTFNFRGAIISQYSDCEGIADSRGSGYQTQRLEWDPNIRNAMPPNFPGWDLSRLSQSTILEYVILSYQDQGALKIQ